MRQQQRITHQQLKRQRHQPLPNQPEEQQQRGQPRHQRRNDRQLPRVLVDGVERTRHQMRRAGGGISAVSKGGETGRAAAGVVLLTVNDRQVGGHQRLDFTGALRGISAASQCRRMSPNASCSLARLPGVYTVPAAAGTPPHIGVQELLVPTQFCNHLVKAFGSTAFYWSYVGTGAHRCGGLAHRLGDAQGFQLRSFCTGLQRRIPTAAPVCAIAAASAAAMLLQQRAMHKLHPALPSRRHCYVSHDFCETICAADKAGRHRWSPLRGVCAAHEVRLSSEVLCLSLPAQTSPTSWIHRLRRTPETSMTTSVLAKFFSTLLGAAVDRNLCINAPRSDYTCNAGVSIPQSGILRVVHSPDRTSKYRPHPDVGPVLQDCSSGPSTQLLLPPTLSAGGAMFCRWGAPQNLPLWVSPYMQQTRSLADTRAKELPFVSSPKRLLSQSMPAGVAFSVGTVCGGFLLWLASFTGLVSGVAYQGKDERGDSAEEADEALVPGSSRAADRIRGKDPSGSAQHLKREDEARRNGASPTSRRHTQRRYQLQAGAGGSSPHYPGDTLPSTEIVLENPGFTSIFSASRREPIFVAEKLTQNMLRSPPVSPLQKTFQAQQEQQQPQLSPDQEEESREDVMQLWGGESPSNNSQQAELRKYFENAEARHVDGDQTLRAETALLLNERQQYPTSEEGDAEAEGEYALLTGAGCPRQGIRFVQDPRIDRLWSPSTTDYTWSGYTRGHLAAAASHSESMEKLKSTFSLGANIVPQTLSINCGVWSRLEALSRYLTKIYDEVFVVSGPLWLPSDLEARWPSVFVFPEKVSTNVPQESKNSHARNTAEGTGNGAVPKNHGDPPPVMYTCLRPYKQAKEVYAVSHESLTGDASPPPPSPKSYSRSNRSGSFSGSRSSQAEDVLKQGYNIDAFSNSQPLELGTAQCKKVWRNLQALESESASGSTTTTEGTSPSPSGRPELRKGDVSEPAEDSQGRRNNSRRGAKRDTGEVSRGLEAALWSMLAGDSSDDEREEEDQYPHLLPGAAVLRGRVQSLVPPLHVTHEAIGSRMVSVPTHFYKIILAVRKNSPKQLQSAVAANDATRQRRDTSSGTPPRTGADSPLSPLVLGAFLVPNKDRKVRTTDMRCLRVPIGFLEFATGLSFQGIVKHAAKHLLQAADDQVRRGAFAGNHVDGGFAAPAARVAVFGQ